MRRPFLVPAAALAVLVLLIGGCAEGEGTFPDASGQDAPGQDAPSAEPSGSAAGTTSDGSGGQADGASQAADLEVTVEGDQVSPNAAELEASTGDTLSVEVQADRAGELHVHSRPEQYVEFEPGSTTTELTFSAPGTVEIEEHDSGAVVAFVDVR